MKKSKIRIMSMNYNELESPPDLQASSSFSLMSDPKFTPSFDAGTSYLLENDVWTSYLQIENEKVFEPITEMEMEPWLPISWPSFNDQEQDQDWELVNAKFIILPTKLSEYQGPEGARPVVDGHM